jgi:hypothetical protein
MYLELSGNEVYKYVLKILYIVCSLIGTINWPSTSFLEKDDIVHLGAISQCDGVG